MTSLQESINEALGVKKSFVLNMKEMDYDKLLGFLTDMKNKNEKRIIIEVESDGRKWFGYSGEDNHRENKTNLN